MSLSVGRSAGKSKSRSKERVRGIVAKPVPVKTETLSEFVDSISNKQGFVRMSTLTMLLKTFGLYKNTNDAERVLRRLAPKGDGLIPKASLYEFFANESKYERGRLTDEDYGKVFDSFAKEGQLPFTHLLKNSEELAHKLSTKQVKIMVKLFGRGKDHITREEFIRAMTRKEREAVSREARSKSKDKDRKANLRR